MKLVTAITKLYGLDVRKCDICHSEVKYPDGVYSRGGKRLYHKACIRARRAELRRMNPAQHS